MNVTIPDNVHQEPHEIEWSTRLTGARITVTDDVRRRLETAAGRLHDVHDAIREAKRCRDRLRWVLIEAMAAYHELRDGLRFAGCADDDQLYELWHRESGLNALDRVLLQIREEIATAIGE